MKSLTRDMLLLQDEMTLLQGQEVRPSNTLTLLLQTPTAELTSTHNAHDLRTKMQNDFASKLHKKQHQSIRVLSANLRSKYVLQSTCL